MILDLYSILIGFVGGTVFWILFAFGFFATEDAIGRWRQQRNQKKRNQALDDLTKMTEAIGGYEREDK